MIISTPAVLPGVMRLLSVLATAASLSAGALAANAATAANPQAAATDGSRQSVLAKAAPKSAKRGIAYNIETKADLKALAPGVSWWYNWGTTPAAGVPRAFSKKHNVDYYPMLWNAGYDANAVEAWLHANPKVKYLLVMNEPNLVEQSNLSPSAAAQAWPGYEKIAADTGVKIVGPQITWGTMPGFSDPVAWMDAFYAAYKAANGGREPRIDYLGFHWYDYGLAGQLDRLAKYNKPFWITEFANWHSQNDGAQIDTLQKQEAQMTDMVSVCEQRADVFRYAWFTGRRNPDPVFLSLLGGDGQLTELGKLYISLPYTKAR